MLKELGLDGIERLEAATAEDLSVIWDYMFDSYRNGAEYPIKEDEALEVMQVAEAIRKGTIFDFHK